MTEKECKSCIRTIELLRRLAYNIHGVMDVIDAENCDKIISMLEQEPKPDVLDNIREEINVARYIDKDTKLCKNANASGLEVAMQIIDKYR